MRVQLISILLLFTTGCNVASAQKTKKEMKQEIAKLEELIKQKLQMVKSYDEKPAYYLQVNKSGCRLLVRVNDIPLGYSFIEDDGESMLYPINDMLLAGGRHTVTIEVYPRSFETVVTKEAWANIKVVHYNEKLVGIPEPVDELTSPVDIGTKNVPVYRDSLSFNAELPFDFKYILAEAKDLRKVDNLEAKVLAHYNKVRRMMIDGEYYQYNRMRLATTWPRTEMNYLGEDALRKFYIDTDELFRFQCEPIDWVALPIENYEMVLCGNGKLVYLRRKKELDEVLRCEYYETQEQKELSPDRRTTWSFLFIALYMPSNSDTLVELY